MANQTQAVERLYDLVANEEDARVCQDISEDACREVPRNFFLILGSLVLTKLGDLLISPKTVLAWLMGTVGAPSGLVAWLVPIRESGSMVPQLAIGAWVRRHPRRGGFWVLGSALQGGSVAGMALAVWLLEGASAGYAIIALLVLFSLSRGLCSVALKDVQGKCVPKSRRGRLTGLASTAAGALTALLSAVLFLGQDPDKLFYSALLLAAALIWLSAAAMFSRIEEEPGETGGGGNTLREAFDSLALLRDDAPFRHFVITRALLLCSALAAPFFVVMAQQSHPGGALLGGFLLASALASSLSASVWGYMADRSSRQVMIVGAALASLTCLLVGAAALVFETQMGALVWLVPAAYFALSVAHAGVRIGRKTYLLDMAGGNKRTDYVAVSNTAIGLLLLVTGGLSALASLISTAAVLLMLGLMGLAGCMSALRLREV
ncbi:MFS transporter [Aquisalimonas sp.]|uniref:MFS transporter n=1 Tax=Aquisalimonas sp. TaxID=1872621 RepID=UPI0025C65FE4|nr:MFS transporter [Aquisalimonas sp.]